MQMVQAMLFDMDGTLVDSVPAHVVAWQRALRACGVDLPSEAVHPEIGKGSTFLIRDLVGEERARQCAETADRLHTMIYIREFLPRMRVFPVANMLFSDLRARGVRVAIVSSAKRNELDWLVRQIAVPPDAVVNGDDVRAAKPEPELGGAALRRLGLSADQAILVGDSPHDFTAARPMGLRGVGVLTGGFTADVLLRAGADRVYENLDDLRAHLGDLLPFPMTA